MTTSALLRRALGEISKPRDLLYASTAARELGRPDIHAFLQKSFHRGMRKPAVLAARDEAIRMFETTELH